MSFLSSIASIAGPVLGGLFGSSASKSAANTQAKAAAQASQTQMAMFNKTQQNLQPWLASGGNALNQLQWLMGLTPPPAATTAAPQTLSSSQLVNTKGAWTPNATLYANDPTYRSAWDNFTRDYQAKYHKMPKGTPANAVTDLAAYGFDLNAYNSRVTAAAQAQQQAAQQQAQQQRANDPTFGSLMKPFTMADFQARTGIQENPAQAYQALTKPFTASDFQASAGYQALHPLLASSIQETPDQAYKALTKPFTAADFQASPGYQWQLDQGLGAIQNKASSLGVTGNMLKDLQTYGQGLANQDWWNAYNADAQNKSTAYNAYTQNYWNTYNADAQNFWNTYNADAQNKSNAYNAYNQNYWNTYNAYTQNQNNRFNMLNALSGSGQNAAANLGGIGTNIANSIAQNQIGAGNAQAAGTIGSANALIGGANNAMQNYLLYNMMNG